MWNPFKKKQEIEQSDDNVVLLPTSNQVRQFFAGVDAQKSHDVAHLTPPAQIAASEGRQLMADANKLARENPYVEGFLLSVFSNVVGAEGFKLKKVSESVRNGWNDWTNSAVDVQGEFEFNDVLEQAIRSWFINGDAFIRLLKVDGDLKLQLINPALLDYGLNRVAKGGRNAIVNGIEVDKLGRKVAYYFQKFANLQAYDHYSAASERDKTRIEAANIVHLYTKKNGDQVRGTTKLEPALNVLRDLHKYQKNEAKAQAHNATKGVIIQRERDEFGKIYETEVNQTDLDKLRNQDVSIVEMREGLKVDTIDYSHNTEFDRFVKMALRSVAVSLGLSYSIVSGDLESTSYASGRIGTMEERQKFIRFQKTIINQLVKPIYRAWCQVNIRQSGKPEFIGVRWQGIDALKDANAQKIRLENGVTTIKQEILNEGGDPDEIFEQRLTERETFGALNDVAESTPSESAEGSTAGSMGGKEE